MQWNNGYIEPYIDLIFDETILISAKNLNMLGNQYESGKYLVDMHNHGDIYYSESESDLKFYHSGNKSGSDADMVDGSHLADLTGQALPKYSIIAWESETIPTGYAICNGQIVGGVATPDLRDYFVPMAGDDYTLGETFGSNIFSLIGSITIDNHTLIVAELPSHRHIFYDTYYATNQGFMYDYPPTSTNALTGYTASASQNTSNVGNGNGHNHTGSITFNQIDEDNRPLYYAIYFIMKVI